MSRKRTTETEPRPFLRRIWREWIRPLAVVVAVLSSFRSAVADWNDVPTQSMEPTILAGERIIVNKLAYDLKVPFTTWRLARWDTPARGDIVVFYSPRDGRRMVKRVVGLPGDEVGMTDNRLLVNGRPVVVQPVTAATVGADDLTDPAPHRFGLEHLDEVTHVIMELPARRARRTFRTITVPDDQYLVMGDNRDNSGDSRVFGYVPRDEILGRVVAVAISLDKDGSYRPRWGRFFQDLD